MVYLSRIYTKTGDDGTTGLGNGARVAKDDARVDAYGTVDEANSVIGLLRLVLAEGHPDQRMLEIIQNDLFDLGADLAVPPDPEKSGGGLRVVAEQVTHLEKAIDAQNEKLRPLTSFVLPGGSSASTHAHLARTAVRRAERKVVTLSRNEPVNPQALIYLNRLSDLLFVMARSYNNFGEKDVLWVPGASRHGSG